MLFVLRCAVLTAALCGLASTARADEPPFVVVERTSGEPLRGRLLDLTGRTFRVQLADGRVVEVPEGDVREVRFEAPAAPAPPQHSYRPIHGVPTASITTEPGTVQVKFEPSHDNEYVMAGAELWRRAGDGPWSKIKALPPGGPGVFEDTPPDPRAAYTYKIVSVGEADAESPVVLRYSLALPVDEVRKESLLLGPVTPGRGAYVVPVAVFADGSAIVQLHVWSRAWQSSRARVLPGHLVGDGTGATLETARIETKAAAPARLVVRLRRTDGRVEEVDDAQALPSSIDVETSRGVVYSTPSPAAPRDRVAEIRAALTSQRPLTANFPHETPLSEVLPFLRTVTGVDIVASPSIDQEQACVRFDVRMVPQAELLTLAFEMVNVEPRPWCGVMWLDVRGAGERWVRTTTSGPAGALLEQARVNLELSRFPMSETLDLLRSQTGLNVVVSGSARDLIDNESLTTTITARDLSLRDALTLIVDGTGTLHWHARGSVVQVLTWSERPTREVAAEQTLAALTTGDVALMPFATEDTGEAWLPVMADWSDYFAGPPTVETLLRELEFTLRQDGNWSVGYEPPARREGRTASEPNAAQTWEVSVDKDDPTRFTAFALERREVVPVVDLRALAASDADLWIEPKAGLFGTLSPGALGLELRGSKAAIAEITSSLAQLLEKADEIEWKAQYSFEKLDGTREFVVRTKSGRLFHLVGSFGRFGGKSRLRFTPLARTGPSAALREATDKADAGDLAGALAAVDRILMNDPRDRDALLVRAQLRLARNDRVAARADAEQVLVASPDHPLALTLLAYALPDGEHVRRLELCTRALGGDPTLLRALVLRAELNAQLDRRDEATRDLREARKLAPEDDTVCLATARVAFAFGDLEEAASFARKAVDLDRQDVRARYTLAKVLEAQGDQEGALRQLEVALARANETDRDLVPALLKDIDALRKRVEAARPSSKPPAIARTGWVVTIDAARHGERAMLRLARQQAVPQAQSVAVVDFDLWVDPVGPAIGVASQIITMTTPGPAIAALSGVEPDATGTRTLAWTDRISGAEIVDGFRFLVRTSGGELFEGVVQRRGEGVLELMFARP